MCLAFSDRWFQLVRHVFGLGKEREHLTFSLKYKGLLQMFLCILGFLAQVINIFSWNEMDAWRELMGYISQTYPMLWYSIWNIHISHTHTHTYIYIYISIHIIFSHVFRHDILRCSISDSHFLVVGGKKVRGWLLVAVTGTPVWCLLVIPIGLLSMVHL